MISVRQADRWGVTFNVVTVSSTIHAIIVKRCIILLTEL